MKMKLLGIIAITAVLCGIILAAGCVSTSDQQVTGTWMLKDNTSVTLTLESNGTYSGHAPINLYGGTYSVNGNGISFGNDTHSTLMAGTPEEMDAEDHYFTSLSEVTSYSFAASELNLLDKHGNVLLTYIKGDQKTTVPQNNTISAAPTTSVAPTSSAVPTVSTNEPVPESIILPEGEVWKLAANLLVTLTFATDGTFSGHAPVNIYGGSYSLRASETEPRGFLIMTPLFSTEMAGSLVEMEAEEIFFNSLAETSFYTISGYELKLFDKNDTLLLTFLSGDEKTADTVNSSAPASVSTIVLPTGEVWKLAENQVVTLEFNADGTYNGQAQVNTYGGNYAVRASETEPKGFLVMSEPYRTKMAGTPEETTAEDTFLKALPKVVAYTISGYELKLTDTDGNTLLTFIKG